MSNPEYSNTNMRNQMENEGNKAETFSNIVPPVPPDLVQHNSDNVRTQIVLIAEFQEPQEIFAKIYQDFLSEREQQIERFCLNHGPVTDYNFRLLESHLLNLEIEKASKIYYSLREQGIKPQIRLNFPQIPQADFESKTATSIVNAMLSLNRHFEEFPEQDEAIKFLYEQTNLHLGDLMKSKPSSDRRPLKPVQKFFAAQKQQELGFPDQYQFSGDPTLLEIVYSLTTGEGCVLLVDDENCTLANNITSRNGQIFIKILDPQNGKKYLKSHKTSLSDFAQKYTYPLDYISRWSGGGVFYDKDQKINQVFTADQIREALNYALIPGTLISSLSSKTLKSAMIKKI